jgi:hypothetical protein
VLGDIYYRLYVRDKTFTKIEAESLKLRGNLGDGRIPDMPAF